MRKIGLVKKKFLTRERIYLIIDYLLQIGRASPRKTTQVDKRDKK